MIKVYGRTTSFNVQKVMWLIEELNLDYEHIELGGRFGGLESDEFALLNPMKKVPVLLDGEKIIWESHTILRYLVAQYGDRNWYPESAFQRSLYERWMDWSQLIFQRPFMAVFWGYYRMPPHKRKMETINEQLGKCDSCLKVIDRQLSQSPFLGGENITLADIPTGAILYRLTQQGLDIDLPVHVAKWYTLLSQRKGYIKWVMSDFSELKSRENF